MRTFKIILLVFLGLFVLAVLFVVKNGLEIRQNAPKLKESQDVLDRFIPTLCKNWDMKMLSKDASPDLKESIRKNGTNVQKALKYSQDHLGRLKSYKISNENIFTPSFSIGSGGSKEMAKYVLDADFEKGKAELKCNLVRVGDQWKVQYFNVILKKPVSHP